MVYSNKTHTIFVTSEIDATSLLQTILDAGKTPYIIHIQNPTNYPKHLYNEINIPAENIIEIYFEDTNPEYHLGKYYRTFTSIHAENISEFLLNKTITPETPIIIQSAKGRSRGAAVAAGVSMLLQESDYWCWDKWYTSPNIHVFRVLLESTGITLTNYELEKRKKINFAAYVRAYNV